MLLLLFCLCSMSLSCAASADMVHALKPNPKNHIQEDWRIADFFSHVPESMHMVSSQASAFLLFEGGCGRWP